MIIVMANGYAKPRRLLVPDLTGRPFGSPEIHEGDAGAWAAFEDDMTQVLIPFIDKTFRTIPIAITAPWPGFRWAACRRSR